MRTDSNRPVLPRILSILGYAAFLAVVTIVSLVVAEIYLRRTVYDPNRVYVLTPGWEIVFKPSPEGTPGIHKEARSRINSLGLRGEVPSRSASPRILTVGGSTTEEIMLEHPDSWPGLLQSHLRKCQPNGWVGNAGRAGTNARHHLRQIKQLVSDLPRLDTIVVLAGLNDMLFDFSVHHPKTLPADWDERQSFMHLQSKDAAGLYERYAIYKLTRRVVAPSPVDGEGKTVRVVDFGAMMKDYKARRSAVRPEDFIYQTPDMREALGRYRQVLDGIVSVARERKVQLVFATQPYIWSGSMGPDELSRLYAGGLNGVDQWKIDPRNPWYHHSAMMKMLRGYNDVMRAVCKEAALVCVDLEATMPRTAAMFYDDFHFSAEGAAYVARQVAAALAPNCKP